MKKRYTAAFVTPTGKMTFFRAAGVKIDETMASVWFGTKKQAERLIVEKGNMLPRGNGWKAQVFTEEETKVIYAETKLKNST